MRQRYPAPERATSVARGGFHQELTHKKRWPQERAGARGDAHIPDSGSCFLFSSCLANLFIGCWASVGGISFLLWLIWSDFSYLLPL